MADEPDNVVELNPGAYKGDDGRFYSRRTGKVLPAHIARKRTPEEFAKMRDGLQRAKEEGRLKHKKPGEAAPDAGSEGKMALMEPKALDQLDRILSGEEQSSTAQKLAAAKLIIEYRMGKPTQRLEIDDVRQITYRLAPHEPLREVSGE